MSADKTPTIKMLESLGADPEDFLNTLSLRALQTFIAEWADVAISPTRSIEYAKRKLVFEELPELTITNFKDPAEFADVMMLLMDIAHLQGIDIQDAIAKKAIVNCNRNWKIDPETGCANHVEKNDE